MLPTAHSFLRGLIAVAVTASLAGCAARTADAPSAAAAGPRHFAEPRAAVDALLAACRANDIPAAMSALLGPEGARELADDQTMNRGNCDRFLRSAGEMTRLDPWGQDRLVLVVGSDDFPLPLPLVKGSAGWSWDAEAGAKEILRRRIGANELAAIALCRAAVQAPEGRSPLPPSARGYVFRALPPAGPKAPAFIAYPSQYGRTGVMTFVVDRSGVVHQRDLGDATPQIADRMNTEPLDAAWRKIDP